VCVIETLSGRYNVYLWMSGFLRRRLVFDDIRTWKVLRAVIP
jgi:hypothetical protein